MAAPGVDGVDGSRRERRGRPAVEIPLGVYRLEVVNAVALLLGALLILGLRSALREKGARP